MLFAFQKVMTMEDYTLLNSIQGSFHQGAIEKFCDTAGRQCTYMTLFAIAYASFRRLDIWRKCTDLISTDYLSVNDLPDRFQS